MEETGVPVGGVFPTPGKARAESRAAEVERAIPGTEPTVQPWHRSTVERALSVLFSGVNRFVPWHRLPPAFGVLNLAAFRGELREKNLHDTSQLPSLEEPALQRWQPKLLTRRTSEGTYNDLSQPHMGSTCARFGRNIPLEHAWPEQEPELLEPSPRVISNRLLARQQFIPAETLNLLAAAWIQFMTHDWFDHGAPRRGNEFRIQLEPGDDWHEAPMLIRRTPADTSRRLGVKDGPPTFRNTGSHWWDASQIYGNDEAETRALLCPEDGKGRENRGKLRLVGIGQEQMLPVDPKTHLAKSGVTNNWWIGLSLLHTLFAKEHNAIVDRLQLEYPTWSGERLFHTARLINTALMAKIHTVEWTPAILGHPTLRIAMNANWWGLFSEHITRLFGRLSRSEELSGIPGAPLDHHGVPYSLTEEFVAVYRMHSLMPDSIRWHRVEDGRFVREDSLPDVSGVSTRSAFEGGLSADDLCYSFGIQHPGALVLHNYPGFLRKLPQRDEDGAEAPIDLAAIDVLRDRERGIPRYNTFRRLLHLRPARSFDDLTSNPQWARELREVYGDVERVDMMVGTLAEDRPQGFGFSDTQFRVFILMASRRLASDRFFTTDYNVNVYSRVGMEWINDNTMCSVLLRHYPDIAPAIRQVKNAFAPWVPIAGWQPRPSRTLH